MMKRVRAAALRKVLLLTVTAAVIGVACTGGKNGDDDDDTSNTPTPVPSPVFPSVVVKMFYDECGALRTDCHSRAVYVADTALGCNGFLALEDTALGSVYYSGSSAGRPTGCPDKSLYDRLLQPASQCTSGEWARPHIAPGVYDSSYLFHKLAGGPYCLLTNGELSAPMPLDHAMPGDLIDEIRDWINDGAPEN